MGEISTQYTVDLSHKRKLASYNIDIIYNGKCAVADDEFIDAINNE